MNPNCASEVSPDPSFRWQPTDARQPIPSSDLVVARAEDIVVLLDGLADVTLNARRYLGAVTAAEARFNDFDEFARIYARASETNPYNALYELPAILAMAGDVRGLRVLDAGCGPGLHAARLIERGAAVTGIDLSGPMIAVARERLGPGVPLHQADLTQSLPFLTDGSFDLVLSSLVMHYLEQWEPALRELRRVLAPRGRLVMSTIHPFADVHSLGGGDYFGTYEYGEDWEREGRIMRVRFWHRPLAAMLAAFRDCGFALDAITEPLPLPEMASSAPETYEKLSRSPQFVIFSLTAC